MFLVVKSTRDSRTMISVLNFNMSREGYDSVLCSASTPTSVLN